MTGWRELDPDELNRQYRLARLVPDLDTVLDGYARDSAAARARFPVRTDLRYGPEGPQTLDLFPVSRPGAPLLVFVHGGFWQESGKEAAAFPASGLLAGGVAFAALGYGLAPRYRLEEMVATTARAVRWLAAHAADLGVDPARIHLAGSSAGAHLAAMAMLEQDLPIGGVILLSGVYDLEPVTRTWVNDALGLTVPRARAASPLLLPLPDRLPPVVLARGEGETAEFARQQAELADRLRAVTALTELVVPGRHHFDLPYDLGDPDSPLGTAVLRQLAGSAQPASTRLPGSSHRSG
ncbi:MAG TPA: alpha/beta hydrolase [Pseudonocardia sp.]|nr:alpha/beta hydrolase [Pseudonocardia sp.]